MSNTTTPARASHQRRPDTYRATGRDGSVYLLDSARPVTHAVIATRDPDGPEFYAAAYVGAEAAERGAAARRAGDWRHVEVVELEAPATTGGRPSMTAAALHALRAKTTTTETR